jgi:hypothetical protein
MGQPKPKVVWTCEPEFHKGFFHFKAVLPWYGIEIKTEVTMLEVDMCIDPKLPWVIIKEMTRAINEAVARATQTITDSLDYDDEETEAAT